MTTRNSIKENRCIPRRVWFSCLCIFYCTIFFSGGFLLQAQDINFTYETYGLENDGDNVIQNSGHLEDFFESLYQLQNTNDRKINIVHIGDSHIQADYLTSVVRRNFHRHFGNAGRGLIVPLRVAGTNEPNNFQTITNNTWKSKRCVFPAQPLPIGIGGVTINTNQADTNLEIIMNDLWLDYTFNALTLFYEKDENSFDFSIRDRGGRELGVMNSYFQESNVNYSRITWEKRIDAVTIQPVKASPHQTRATIYGAVLENSMNGILYHTIGVNGAKFRNYNEAEHFAEQTAALRPDLFIISLGTNEAIDYPYLDKNFPSHIDKLVLALRHNNPMAKFILVTPQDVYQRKNKPNPGIRTIREQIIQYAVENGLAFYDLYRAMGGENSAKAWSQSTLLRSDGIHLTKDGYEYQGNLFYHALMKGYNLYVPTRHP
jgi:lysophospholipase L1-like esterase